MGLLHFVDRDSDIISPINIDDNKILYEEIVSYMDYENNNIVTIINNKMYSLNLDSLNIEIKNAELQHTD